MKIHEKLVGVIVFIIIYSMLLSSTANAVNSFCTTGPTSKLGHKDCKQAVIEANDELNDYFNGNDDHHDKDTDGRSAAGMVMMLQKYQQQTYIFAGHGIIYSGSNNGGDAIVAGDGTNEEKLYANAYKNIKTSDKSGYLYTPYPFGVFLFIGAKTADDQTNKDNFVDIFGSPNGWLFIGAKGSIRSFNAQYFIEEFADKITDGKKTYERAFHEAEDMIPGDNPFKIKSLITGSGSTSDLNHDTKYDKYRSINRVRYQLPLTINKGEDENIEYQRMWTGTTNGGYFVFHGILNNIEQNTNLKAKVKVKLYHKSNGVSYPISDDTYVDIHNQKLTIYGKTSYGGSDTITRRVSPNVLTAIGSETLVARVTLVDDQDTTADYIKVDRFEFIEIGN